MTPARLRWFAAIAFILVLGAGYFSLTRHVTVLADGRAYELNTRAVTVGGALKALGIELGKDDAVEPASLVPLRNGLIIAVRRAALVQLSVDGELYQGLMATKDPADILAQWDVSLGEGDRLLLAGETITLDTQLPSASALVLEVRRAVPVTVVVDGETIQFASSAPTLGQALIEEGIDLKAGDKVEPQADTPLTAAVSASVTRGRQLTITTADGNITLASAATTVGEALADAGIALQGLDRSQPAEEQPVPEDGEIRIVRVHESMQLAQESLPHATEWQPDDTAELDQISVVQLGQDGVQASRVRVRTEDGEEISRETEAERIVVEPTTQINGYGTKIVLRTAVVDGVTIEYYRKATFRTTWYSPCNSGVSDCLNGTASGLPVQRGTVASYLNYYRALVGATMYIPGYGFATLGDTSGANSNGREPWLDLAFSEAEVAALGGQPWVNAQVTVYFTTPIPAYVPPVWPP